MANPLASGAEALFGALLGGGATEEAARQKEELRLRQVQLAEATLDDKMTDALLNRDKRKAQQDYRANLKASGFGDGAADLVSNLLIGGHGAQIDDVQKYGMRDRAVPALEAQGFSPANAILAALDGKPLSEVDVDSGHIIRDRFSASPTVAPTEEMQSRAVENNAQANASDALAWRRRNQPLTSGGGSGGGRSGGGAGGGREPTLSNHPGTGAKVTREAVKLLMSDVSLYRSDFIRKYGTAAYRAVMDKRQDYRSAERRDRKAADKDR